jgi:hypothetical protein
MGSDSHRSQWGQTPRSQWGQVNAASQWGQTPEVQNQHKIKDESEPNENQRLSRSPHDTQSTGVTAARAQNQQPAESDPNGMESDPNGMLLYK